jgi:hypothetical protein
VRDQIRQNRSGLFFSSAAAAAANPATASASPNSSSSGSSNPGLEYLESKIAAPEVWKCVTERVIHDGLEHLAMGLLPLSYSDEMESELRAALKQLIAKSKSLTVASSIVALRNASRFRFSEPSMQLSWSAPGYGSGSSTLFPGSAAAGSGGGAADSPVGVTIGNNAKPAASHSSSSGGATSSGTSSAAARSSGVDSKSTVAASLRSSAPPPPLAGSAAGSSSASEQMIATPYSTRRLGSSVRDSSSTAGSQRGSLTSPASSAAGRPGSPPPAALRPATGGFSDFTIISANSAAALSPLERQALLPLIRACCCLSCKLATYTEKAHDTASFLPESVKVRVSRQQQQQQVADGGSSAAAAFTSSSANPERKPGALDDDSCDNTWFSVDDLTYKVDDYSWATLKVVGGRAVAVMVIASQAGTAASEQLSIEDLISHSNAVSLLTFDEVFSTTLDQST